MTEGKIGKIVLTEKANCKLAHIPSGIANDRSTATALNITPSRGGLGSTGVFILII